MRTGATTLVFLALLGCSGEGGRERSRRSAGAERPTPVDPVSGWRYAVTIADDLRRLNVEACFEGKPERLHPHGDAAADLLVQGSLEGLRLEDGLLVVTELDEGCVRYGVDLDRGSRLDDPLAANASDGVLVGSTLWLWGPQPLEERGTGTVRFEGAAVHSPWEERSEGTHLLPPSAFRFDAVTVFGDAAQTPIRVGTGRAQVSVVTLGASLLSEAELARWLGTVSTAVRSLYEEMPFASLAITLVPGELDRPVGVGHAYRGGGASMVLRIDRGVTLDALLHDDWVTIHELVHFGLPYVREGGAWLDEGLTTYYQEILRARSGMQSERDAWARIHQHVEEARGKAPGTTLRQLSGGASEPEEYVRLYWSGAALMLLTDVTARREQLGTLDEAVRALRRQCAGPPAPYAPEKLVAHMDGALVQPVVRPIADQWLDRSEVPDLAETWAYLGIEPTEDGIRLNDEAPGASVRRAIVASAAAAPDDETSE